MQNGGVDKSADHNQNWNKNYQDHAANARTNEMGKRNSPVRKHSKRLKRQLIDEIENQPEAAPDNCVKQRFAETAFTSHRSECFARSRQDHLQRFNESGKQSFAVAIIPRQTASRR